MCWYIYYVIVTTPEINADTSGSLGFIYVNFVHRVPATGEDVKEQCQVEGVLIPIVPEDRGI